MGWDNGEVRGCVTEKGVGGMCPVGDQSTKQLASLADIRLKQVRVRSDQRRQTLFLQHGVDVGSVSGPPKKVYIGHTGVTSFVLRGRRVAAFYFGRKEALHRCRAN